MISNRKRTRFNLGLRVALWEAHGKKCAYCGEPIKFKDTEIDHIVPHTLFDGSEVHSVNLHDVGVGDSFDPEGIENLLPAHRSCNLKKGSLIFDPARINFFLELARSKWESVRAKEEKFKIERNQESLLCQLALGVERGSISIKQIQRELLSMVSIPPDFRLSSKIELQGGLLKGPMRKEDIPTLMDHPIYWGTSDPDGLEMHKDDEDSIHVKTAREWINAYLEGYRTFSNFELKSEFYFKRVFGLLYMLSKAQHAEISYVTNPRVGLHDLHLIPRSLSPFFEFAERETVEEKAERGKTVSDWLRSGHGDVKFLTRESIDLIEEDWHYTFWELIRADFTGNEIEDILVYGYEYTVIGTYGHGELFLLERDSPDAIFTVTEVRPWDEPGAESFLVELGG